MENENSLNQDAPTPGGTGEIHEGNPKEKKGKGGTGAARQSLYRVTVRNQLRSISIADQKANILIGINTILISIIIAGIGMGSSFVGLDFVTDLVLSIPFTFFLITCFISAWLAILAVRPMIKPWKNNAPKTLFFKDYVNIDLRDFQDFVDEVIESGDNVYETLNTDMWIFGKTIIRKYNLLRFAYSVFMIGLAGLVIMFLIIHLLT